jgi:hypothetical protein
MNYLAQLLHQYLQRGLHQLVCGQIAVQARPTALCQDWNSTQPGEYVSPLHGVKLHGFPDVVAVCHKIFMFTTGWHCVQQSFKN